MMLVLQTVAFSVTAYAESVPSESEAEAVSEADSPGADEAPSAPEAVYDVPNNNFMVMTAAPTDKTAVFMEANSTFPLKVTQGTPAVDIDPGGTIQGRQPFTLKSEGLKLPVVGDDNDPTNADPSKYIQKGDWIELKREDYFKEVVLPTANKPLMAATELGQKSLGMAYFTPNSIKIVFNGDDYFFGGIGRKVTFGFETTADADVTGMGYNQTKPITIFGGSYDLFNPDITPAYVINMRSMSNNQPDYWRYSRGNIEIKRTDFLEGVIQWKADVSASDRDDVKIPVPLDGTTFSNDLTKVGELVENSFQVLDSRGNLVSATPIYSGGKLTYTFPPGFGDKATITFKTWIPKKTYYYEYRDTEWGNRQIIYNFSQLYDSADQELVNSKKAYPEDNGWGVGIKPDWIQAGATYDHPSETITWKVTVNPYNKKGLKDFTITNVLPDGLDFVSATWQTWVDGVASSIQNITPDDNGVYTFGKVDGKVELIIKSKVKSGSSFRIDPRANWNLDTPGGIQDNDVTSGKYPVAVTDEATVTVGAHTFTKTYSLSLEDYNKGGVTWTVKLKPQYALPDAAVYDVLVHGGDLNVLDNAVDETGEVDKTTIAKIKQNSTGYYTQLWRQYQKDTLKSTNENLIMKAIPLTVDGKVVADLIKVTGYTDPGEEASFSFRSVVTNPDILFRQNIETSKWQYNRALLFDSGSVKTADTYIALYYRMLNKDMLFASKPLKADGTPETVTPNNVASYIRNDSNEAWTISAYDRETKTVTFRLGVNMPGYNTEEMAKDGGNRVISNIKLVDTLPEGWEFVPFSEGKDFELWKGYSDNGSGREYGVRNDAISLIEPGTSAHVVSFSHNENVGTFSFSKLESPYVILVKARPSNAALEKYLEEYTTNGTDRQVLYNRADLHMTWGGVEKTVTEQRKVIVPIQTLGKTVSKPTPGVLEWKVNYTPPFNMEQGVFLQDTIGANMNLRYDADGKLVLTAPSMAVYRAKLTASGALESEGAALDLKDPNAEVKVEAQPGADGKTILTFKMDDPNQFYQFVYQTEVDNTKAKVGDKMGNEVKLVGDDRLKSVSATSETTLSSSDVAGASASNAQLSLKKVDPNNNPLEGVEFTLYKKDDDTVVAKGKTKIDGKLDLLFPDPGYYELKETYIDTNTWLPTTRVYQVYVGNTPGKPIWVDGIKVDTNNPLVVPTPVWVPGDLKLSTAIEGLGADPNKEFEYTISFSNHKSYAYNGSASGTIADGGTVKLKGGQSITIKDIPDGITYTIVQKSYANDGYTTDPENLTCTGSIVKEQTVEAKYVNAKYLPGKLTIGKTVAGNGADKNKAFDFTVTFEGPGAGKTYSYTTSDDATGTVQSGGKISLKHGETAVIDGIPKDTIYTVTEADYTAEGYTTTWPDRKTTGTITDGGDHEAGIVNTRMVYGGLLIGETVVGNGADKNKDFEFTVQFPDAAAGKAYAYTKSDGTTGTIKSGDKITLKHGETVAIEGIPSGDGYIVTQTDYSGEDYTADPANRKYTGEIVEKQIAEARYVNARYLPGQLTLTAVPEVVPGNGKTPSQLTATLTDYEGKPVANEEVIFLLPDQSEVKATTDEQGKAVISYTPPELKTTTPEDHFIVAKVDSLTEGKLTSNIAKVTTVPAAIIGVLRDNETGEVIPNATIVITDKTNGKEHEIKTDADGAYFYPVLYGGDYTISYTKLIEVGGVEQPITFTQKAQVEGDVKGGELVPADITAVGVVLLKQPEGQSSLMTGELAGKMRIYLRDANDQYVKDQDGAPKAFPLQPNGAFSADGLTAENYKMEVRYEFEPGQELTIVRDAILSVKASGELNISQELVDPYGIITDKNTGAVIEGAEVTLYYADTPENKAKGIVPGTKVTLRSIPGFAPNDNASPSQYSDATGAYAYMVFPNTDYYLVVTKTGYVTHTSDLIRVGSDIVRYNVELSPVSTGGNSGGGGTGGGSDSGYSYPVPVTPVPNPVKPEPGSIDSINGTVIDSVTGNVDNGTGNVDTGAGNVDNGAGNVDNGTGNVDNGTGSVDTGAGNNVDNGIGNAGNEADNVVDGPGIVDDELDDVPETGDHRPSPISYLILALLSLITIGICLLDSKKKKHIL